MIWWTIFEAHSMPSQNPTDSEHQATKFRRVWSPMLVGAAALGLLGSPRLLHASDRQVLSIEDLVERSAVVAFAKHENSKSEWQGTRIVTRHRLAVNEVWKGQSRPGARLEMVTFGGVIGEIGQRVTGQVEIPEGAELVVFLAQSSSPSGQPIDYRLVGRTQGVFNIKRNRGDSDGLALRSQFAPNVDRESPILTLAVLRRSVKALVHGR